MANIIDKKIYEEEFLTADVAVIDFYADWCGPCKQMLPIIDEIDKEYGSKIKIGKINVDKNPEVAQIYKVFTIPTIIILKKGEVYKKFVGLTPKEDIIKEF